MKIFNGIAELVSAAGTELGSSEWTLVDQKRIDSFADATGDHQWIHVDPAKAAAGPFGGTIAHGMLTVSLVPAFLFELYDVDGILMAINYGLNKVRFPAPVPSGSRLRGTSKVVEVTQLDGAVQWVLSTTVEIEGGTKPACVAESIVRYIG
jgi:acyl dehydratase